MISPAPSGLVRRRAFCAGILASALAVAACSNGVDTNNAQQIDARVDATLSQMFAAYPNTIEIAQRSAGMLIMPVVTEAGFWVGGAFGQGALRINGATVDFYSVAKASAGFQFGAQQYAHVLFFMTEDALAEFRAGSGWTAGADIGYVLSDTGGSLSATTTTLRSPVLAAVFNQAGLFAGASLEGSKYTRIIP